MIESAADKRTNRFLVQPSCRREAPTSGMGLLKNFLDGSANISYLHAKGSSPAR
jgi:hypothetical protein